MLKIALSRLLYKWGKISTIKLALCFISFFCIPYTGWADPTQIPEPQVSPYVIAVHCSANLLQLWHKGQLVREYAIDGGKGGLGKRHSGDHKTPIGDYRISWIAARNGKGEQIIDGKSWCKDNKFMISNSGPYLEKLWTDPYGGDQAAVMSINYPNEKELEMGYTGDCIHIHADRRHDGGFLKKSYGCIHMYPEDARELYAAVEIGTPVKILP